jgi:hypothetical protein
LQVCADFQIGVDRFGRAKPEMWVLVMAERASTTFGCVVGRLPGLIAEERAEPSEMVGVQVLLLAAQRRQIRRLSIGLPDPVPLLRVSWSSLLAAVVFLDGEPRFKEYTSHT